MDAFKVISRRYYGIDFSPPNGGNIVSLKCKSANLALKTSPIKGSKYLMIDGESKPT